MMLGIFKKRARVPNTYTVVNDGSESHTCKLPPARRFNPGAIIRCECGIEYEYFVNWASGPDWIVR